MVNLFWGEEIRAGGTLWRTSKRMPQTFLCFDSFEKNLFKAGFPLASRFHIHKFHAFLEIRLKSVILWKLDNNGEPVCEKKSVLTAHLGVRNANHALMN